LRVEKFSSLITHHISKKLSSLIDFGGKICDRGYSGSY